MTPIVQTTVRIKVEGLHCWECAGHLALALEAHPGVQSAIVDALTGESTLRLDPGVDLEEILAEIRAEHYEVQPALAGV